MIVAATFGWSAVSDEPMGWVDYMAARQLLAEERIGRRLRNVERAEDDEFLAARQALERG